jgi:hypothetical protein
MRKETGIIEGVGIVFGFAFQIRFKSSTNQVIRHKQGTKSNINQ